MKKFLLTLAVFSQVYASGYFSIQTNPPPNLNGFICECSFEACSCKQGDISLSLNLDTVYKPHWLMYASKNYFGDIVCESPCINAISEVTAIKIPFLSVESLEQSVKTASSMFKKSMSFTERVTYSFQEAFKDDLEVITRFIPFISREKHQAPVGFSSEDVMSIVREKTLQASKSQSESLKTDLTLYLLTAMARDFFGKKDILASDYMTLIRIMSHLSREGKLYDFITLYLTYKKDPKKSFYVNDLAYLLYVLTENPQTKFLHDVYLYKYQLYSKEPIVYYYSPKTKTVYMDSNYLINYITKHFSQKFSNSEYVLQNPSLFAELVFASILADIVSHVRGEGKIYGLYGQSVGNMEQSFLRVSLGSINDAVLAFADIDAKPADAEKRELKISNPAVTSEDPQQVRQLLTQAKMEDSSLPFYLWLLPVIPVAYFLWRRLRWTSKK